MTSPNLSTLTCDSPTPFDIKLNDDQTVVCKKLLRVIPYRRIVCLAEYNGQTVIAKLFLDPIRAAAHLTREQQGLTALHNANIPAPKIITTTKTPDNTQVLILEYIADAQSPYDILKQNPNTTVTQNVLSLFFNQLATFHNAGLLQSDLHLNNFLYKSSENILYAIDAAQLKTTTTPVNNSQRLDNLILFFAQFDQSFYSQLFVAFDAYTQNAPNAPIDTTQLKSFAIKRRKAIWQKRIKKHLTTSTKIVRIKKPTSLILCDREHVNGPLRTYLDNPEQTMESPTRFLKRGNSATVSLLQLGDHAYAVKQFNIKNFTKLLRRQIPPSRLFRNWLAGHHLIFCNIPTPKPIAMVENRFGPFRHIGYMVTEYIDAPHIMKALFNASSMDEKKHIVTRFAQLLKTFRLHRISHGDMKYTNFLISPTDVYIIDLDSIYWHKNNITFNQAHNKDCQRFLQNFQDDPELYQHAKSLIEKIEGTPE